MTYDINSALERLENNLKDIDSARLQVEKTITSSNNLQLTISTFVKSLKSLHADVENLITDLERYQSMKKSELELSVDTFKFSCKSTISTFNKEIAQSSTAFKVKMNETLSFLQGESSNLATQIKELMVLKASLNSSTNATKRLENKVDFVSQEHNQSLKNQDIMISSIKSIVENIKNQVSSLIPVLESNFVNLNSEIKNILEKTNTIIFTQSELKATCSKIESELISTKESTEAILNNLNKNTKMNRLLIIIGFIILAVLQFIN